MKLYLFPAGRANSVLSLKNYLDIDCEVERLEFLHHQGSGGVLGESLVDPDRDLLTRFHPAVEEVCTDDLASDCVRHR